MVDKMIILGVRDGHDAGACILKDGKIVSAINEERLKRQKMFCGMPELSIKKVMEIANVGPGQIDKIAMGGTLGIMTDIGWTKITPTKKFYQSMCKNLGSVVSSGEFVSAQRALFRWKRDKSTERFIRSLGIDAPIEHVDHHLAHAASAYYTSGKKDCLVITSDGSGDGLSSSIYLGKDGELKMLKEVSTYNSIAYYYAYITLIAGFKMFRHEGKITGLAAHGDPKKCKDVFDRILTYSDKRHQPENRLGLMGQDAIKALRKMLASYSMMDYAAGIQDKLEEVMTRYASDYVKKSGVGDIAMAGGIFANVKVNQRISDVPEVSSVFIHPHMGDGGLSVGAALYVYGKHMLEQGSGLKPFVLNDVYFGPEYNDNQIQQAIECFGLKAQKVQRVENLVAEKLVEKKIVGHFNGRMEYGPRALGNRSVLADPTDKTINDWLNKRMKRTEFMPFAPSLLESEAEKYMQNYDKSKYPASFMTITFDVTKMAEKKSPAIVHVDGTARPQTVTNQENSRYHKILKAYQNASGLPIFINTSFNMHEEPIVCSPEDAIRSMKARCVDVLVMGNWVVEK